MPPLNWQTVQVPIGGGLDQHTDPRLLGPGKVTTVTNGVYTKLGSVAKRLGYSSAPLFGISSGSSGFTGAVMPGMQQLMTAGDEMVGIDYLGDFAWSVSPTANNWMQVGAVPPCSARRDTVAAGTTSFSTPDVAYYNGLIAMAWIGGSTNFNYIDDYSWGGIYVSVIDAVTKSQVLPPSRVCGNGVGPRVVFVGSNLVVMYLATDNSGNGGLITMNVITIPGGGSPPTISAPSQPALGWGDPAAPWTYDVATDGKYLYVTHPTIVGGQYELNVLAIDTSLGVLNNVTHNTFSTVSEAIWSVSIDAFSGSSGLTYLGLGYGWQDNSNVGSLSVYEYSFNRATWVFNTTMSETNVYTGPGIGKSSTADNSPYSTYTGIAYKPDDGSAFAVVGNIGVLGLSSSRDPGIGQAGSQQKGIAKLVLATHGGSSGSFSPLHERSCYWAETFSKPFWVPDTSAPRGYRVYAFASAPAPYLFATGHAVRFLGQGTEHLFDLGLDDELSLLRVWRPVATIAPRASNRGTNLFQSRGMQCHVATDGSGSYYTMGQTDQEANFTFLGGRTGLELLTINFRQGTQYEWDELGRNLHIAAGVPTYYDGVTTGEIGFSFYPDVRPGTTDYTSYNGNGSMDSGTYQYAVTYEWYDAKGQVHQSAPSVQASVVTGPTGSVDIFIPNLTVTTRNAVPVSGSQSFPQAVIWRSTAGGSILYRLTPENGVPGLFCYPNSGSLVYTDTANDSDNGGLSTRTTLYTEGGVLANFSPPSSRLCATHANRLWLSGQDNPKSIWYSQQYVDGQAVSFNDGLSFTIDDGGDITGILGMDANLIVFKRDRIFAVAGNGPNPLGQQNDLQVVPVPATVGCINSRSLVLTDDGIMFQSDTGIMLLTRALEVQYVGYPVEDLLAQRPVISSAVVVPGQSHVRFTCISSFSTTIGSNPNEIDGIILVYDYLAKAWSNFAVSDPFFNVQNAGAAAAVLHDGTYKVAAASFQSSVGSVWQEKQPGNATAYIDGSIGYVPLTIETGWVATNDIQGFQRVKHVQVLGQILDNCDIQLYYATDYSPTYNNASSFPTFHASPTANASYQLHVGDQRCEAIRIKIADVSPTRVSATTGQGLTVTRVGIIAGTKPGMNRLPPGQRS